MIRYVFRLYPDRINVADGEHRTALHLAASLGDLDTCRVLIGCEARVNALLRTSTVRATRNVVPTNENLSLQGTYVTPTDLARTHRHSSCANYLAYQHGGQRGMLLVNILARRIQRCLRRYRLRQPTPVKATADGAATHGKTKLLKQAKLCVDERKDFDQRHKAYSFNLPPTMTRSRQIDDDAVHERRRTFAKSRTTLHHSEESSRLIIHATHSSSTLNKLCDRRKLIADELVKIKRARLYNHYVGKRTTTTTTLTVLYVATILDHHQSTVVQDPDRERLQSTQSTCRGNRSLSGETARRLRNGTRVDQDTHASKREHSILITHVHTGIRRAFHRS